jgi:lipoyl-dependent peroxiredoxin subunit D
MDFSAQIDSYFERHFRNQESTIFRDLSLNLRKLLEDSSLEPAERYMNLLAISTALHNKDLMFLARSALATMALPAEQIQEASEVAGIMAMNNVYYKFKSYLLEEVKEEYSRAGLRMQSLMKPLTGKLNFEMMSLAVSIVNGCPTCVSSHERAVRQLGMSADKVHDVARLAAVCKGLDSLKVAQAEGI